VTRSDARVVTGLMLGAFLAFGIDTLVIVTALWSVGRLSDVVAGAVSAAVVLAFACWVSVRWLRIRSGERSGSDDGTREAPADVRDPLDGLQRRYATGELSEAEFEERLEALLDADRRAESPPDATADRTERSRESE
jgi:uncharacterized membrane protein